MNACLDACTRAFDRWERDGEYRWVSDIGVPRFNADGSFAGFIGSCIDITDRKIAEEELTNMGRKLIEAHEEERTWIGRELHDDINQRIALLTIELDRWNQTAGSSSDIHGHIRKISQRLVEIGEDIQALSHRLHSSKLEYLGITIAAQSFCRELSERYQGTDFLQPFRDSPQLAEGNRALLVPSPAGSVAKRREAQRRSGFQGGTPWQNRGDLPICN